MNDYYRRKKKGWINPTDPTNTSPANNRNVKSLEEAKSLYIDKCKGDRLSEFTG